MTLLLFPLSTLRFLLFSVIFIGVYTYVKDIFCLLEKNWNKDDIHPKRDKLKIE